MTDDLEPTQDTATPTPTDPTTRVDTPATPLTPAMSTTTLTPVVATRPPRRPRSRFRWAISIAVVALIIATTAAVAAVITGRSTQATVLGYVPDNTVSYTEVRLDLPGDQRRAVGEFLSKFPGFADQSALESKLDQVLDDLRQGRHGRYADLHDRYQAVVRWRARPGARAAPARLVPQGRRRGGDGLCPGTDTAVGHRPGRRPGMVRHGHHEERRDARQSSRTTARR